MFKQFSHFV